MQIFSSPFEAQYLLTGEQPAAAFTHRADDPQIAQFAETSGFLAAAQHHVIAHLENQSTRLLADAKGKRGGVAARAVFMQQAFQKTIGEPVGVHRGIFIMIVSARTLFGHVERIDGHQSPGAR